MPAVPISEIVAFTGGRYAGPDGGSVDGVAPLAEAGTTQLSFLSNPKYAPQLASTRAAAILVSDDLPGDDERFIRVANPYFAMASVVAKYFDRRPMPQGISPLASIDATATIGVGVAVGPFSTIGAGVILGDGAAIFPNVTIESGSVIGERTIVYPQVSIYDRSIIGKRCIIHSGVVIGADGYGFATQGGRHHKIPQIGIVRIGDDVEIGAGCTIDRAALGETVIGDGTKIDDLVMIAHNVKVGRHCLLVAQVGIAGSTELGDGVVVAGQSGFAGHLKIGNGVQVAAKSAVLDDVPDGAKVMGIPAVPFREFARREAMLRRLVRRKRDSQKDSTLSDE
ncbi:MAG TPA: UDP-3-O-(3-hydroxymyristoyl)glucosamine N-acyltransferase [Thermoanaerobaculia bacterium]|jgi:UDP-3-O-[3-hydroxymyristoyl] glucosamine N-acyltransferase|nr:UDP-3-O-(3-hydroxymyristoyl)glucosamine N-acyltransferase [Thermoanaerobaculia bacterium]